MRGDRIDTYDDTFGPAFEDKFPKLIAQLQQETQCLIVVISSWRHRAEGGIKAMNRMAEERHLPFTFHDTLRLQHDHTETRGELIAEWLQDNANDTCSYCILDDSPPDFFLQKQRPFLVQTDAFTSMNEDDFARAKAILTARPN